MDTRKRGLGSDPLRLIEGLEPKTAPTPKPSKRPQKTEKGLSERDILALKDRPLSGFVADFYICGNCSFVDRDMAWETTIECSHCGRAITNAHYYFPKAIHSLIDLIQSTYHSQTGGSAQTGYDQRLATAIFTCRLADTLLDHLLQQIMVVARVPARVANQLMSDNDRGRGDKLFSMLTGDTWGQAVERVNKVIDLDLAETDRFRTELKDRHDSFFRRGEKWKLDEETPLLCLQHIWPFLNLFVGLHNAYVSRSGEPLRRA